MNTTKILTFSELVPYTVIGGVVTLIDWSVFSISTLLLGIQYQVALIVTYFIAGSIHYLANKFITFHCHAKQAGTQVSLYMIVGLMSLGISLGVITLFVKCFAINQLGARVLTTLVMLLPNYLLHKHITFSKKLFAQPPVNAQSYIN